MTFTILFVSFGAGVAEFSDAVFVSVHTTICFEELVVPVVVFVTGVTASAAAFELMKNSVPPLSVSNWPFGDCAGQTVNPGWVGPSSLGALTEPEVSKCTTVTLAAPAASCVFEKA